MKENFAACFAETERWEGWHKFANDPRDPGGATYCGLTQGVFDGWCRKQSVARRSVKFATDQEVQEIFRLQYWGPIQGDELWAGLDMLMFDRAINEGPLRPTRDLQRILGVSVDGQLGLETLGALQARNDHSAILLRVHQARLDFWRSLGRLWPVFGKGWTARETDVYVVAQHMMYATPQEPYRGPAA